MVMLLALVAVLSIWPFRVWTNVQQSTGGGEFVEMAEGKAKIDYNYRQSFVTQYDRLSSIDVYIGEMFTGKYLTASILNEGGEEVLRVIVDTSTYELPGFVTIPMELNVEVGKGYSLRLDHSDPCIPWAWRIFHLNRDMWEAFFTMVKKSPEGIYMPDIITGFRCQRAFHL